MRAEYFLFLLHIKRLMTVRYFLGVQTTGSLPVVRI